MSRRVYFSLIFIVTLTCNPSAWPKANDADKFSSCSSQIFVSKGSLAQSLEKSLHAISELNKRGYTPKDILDTPMESLYIEAAYQIQELEKIKTPELIEIIKHQIQRMTTAIKKPLTLSTLNWLADNTVTIFELNNHINKYGYSKQIAESILKDFYKNQQEFYRIKFNYHQEYVQKISTKKGALHFGVPFFTMAETPIDVMNLSFGSGAWIIGVVPSETHADDALLSPRAFAIHDFRHLETITNAIEYALKNVFPKIKIKDFLDVISEIHNTYLTHKQANSTNEFLETNYFKNWHEDFLIFTILRQIEPRFGQIQLPTELRVSLYNRMFIQLGDKQFSIGHLNVGPSN